MNLPGATILIVDDDPRNRKLLKVLLQHEGYRAVGVGSGDEALALIERQAPDLILLDVMMPVLDGYQVARILKAHPLSLNIPIIMMSAQGDRTARLAGLTAGAEEFLAKPIDRDELWLRVRNLLRLKADADLVRDNSVVLEERVLARTLDLQKFRSAMDATADAVALIDRTTMRYIEANAAASALTGYTRDEFMALPPGHVSGTSEEAMAREYDLIISGETPVEPREAILRRRDGGEISVEVNRQALQTSDGWTIVVVARDITHRKQTEARLQHLAHYDTLTGLPNRRLFKESLEKAIEQAIALDMQVVLLYLDLDDFKDVNDTFGHTVGDDLLNAVGQRLLGTLYPRDSVGRLGGDEFGIVLLTPREPEIAITVADRIHDALRPPFELGGQSIRASVSIGISVYPTDTSDPDALARYADMAMYEAKRSGRNASRFYTATMNQRVSDRLDLVVALRLAIERSEFVLHYQPKVSLRSGRWTGVEALLRWNRPGHGLVAPNRFIPALEESGLIVPVGAWIISEACRQLARWRDGAMGAVPIAVNVSALQIAHQHAPVAGRSPAACDAGDMENVELLPAVRACMRAHDVGPGLLEIEITESVVMADAERSIEMLRQLRAMGVRLSVDDFGTGYSSLSYLRRFPLESVKIDGSFVRDVTTSAEAGSIAVAIIEMAHRLNLKVIAECVETAEQMQFLQAHDCDQAQGYYFAKPMPAGELEALWHQHQGEFTHLVASPADADQVEVFTEAWSELTALVAAFVRGSRAESFAIVDRRIASGCDLVEVERHLIRPALYAIGQLWHGRLATVAQEHLATSLALEIMGQTLWSSPKAKANGRKALLACVRDNHHAVGLQMVSNAFRLAGWEVNFLGANVPTDAILKHTRQWQPDVVALSASLPEHVRELEVVTRQLLRSLGDNCPQLMLGGQGLKQADRTAERWGCALLHDDPRQAVIAADVACRSARARRAPFTNAA